MRKLVVILLLLLYTSTNVGATVHLHYCMNELIHLNLWKSSNDKCGKCGMTEKKNGCCEDKMIQIKLDVDHQKSLISEFKTGFNDAFHQSNYFDSTHLYQLNNKDFFPGWYTPPPGSGAPLHIYYCVFII